MNQQLERIESKIDKINEQLTKLTIVSEVTSNKLVNHLSRIDKLEDKQQKIMWGFVVLLGVSGGQYLPELIKIFF